jgi:hypothetical protein
MNSHKFLEMEKEEELSELINFGLNIRTRRRFIVCRKVCSNLLDSASIDAIKSLKFNEDDPIFQDHPDNRRENDRKRLQNTNPQLEVVDNINDYLVQNLACGIGDKFIGHVSVLKSPAGCRQQRYHLDNDDRIDSFMFSAILGCVRLKTILR